MKSHNTHTAHTEEHPAPVADIPVAETPVSNHEHTTPVADPVAEPTEAAAAAPAAAPAALGTKDGAKVLLADGTPRIDYIRKRWDEGATRSTITKEINEKRVAGTEPIPYQIVFAATKGRPQPAAIPGSPETTPATGLPETAVAEGEPVGVAA